MINAVLSAFSGLFTGITFNLPSLFFLVWFSFTPFIYAISRSNFKGNLLNGISFGILYYGVSIFWVMRVTILGFVLLLLYLSLYCIGFSLLARYFLHKPLRIITLPCLWVIIEFLKENIWCGFGWANLGYSQYLNIYFIKVADLFGVKFISFLIMMFNVLIYEIFLWLKKDDKRKKNIIFIKVNFTFLVLFACFLYSIYRLGDFTLHKFSSPKAQTDKDQLEPLRYEDSLKISIVQPNIPQELKWKESSISGILDKLKILGKETEEDSLVIFPEASWPFIVDKDNFSNLQQFIKGIKRDTLIGSVTEENGQFYNSALQLNQKAKLLFSYHKIKLVPFGEYVPLRKLLSFVSVINSIGDISRGNEFVEFLYKNKKFSVLICFEDIFPLHVRRFAKKNDFLVNITNDAWFGGEPESGQHLSIMVLRAIENRISIVRSSNTGISGWVSFLGKVEKLKSGSKEVLFPGTQSFLISLNKKRSFYNKYGEVFPFFCVFLLLGFKIIERIPKG